MTHYPHSSLTDEDLITRLRRAASAWFKNDDLLLLEELIRRFSRSRDELRTVLAHVNDTRTSK